jgi:hypothetical protein
VTALRPKCGADPMAYRKANGHGWAEHDGCREWLLGMQRLVLRPRVLSAGVGATLRLGTRRA